MNEEKRLPFTEIIETDGKSLREEASVEFRLLYQGRLTADGTVADKFAIRRQLHPQLLRLCSEHSELHSQIIMYGNVEAQQTLGDSATAEDRFRLGVKRLADTKLNGFTFMPLSREEWHLRCSLDVLFLRREKPGKIFMKGDIDNRLKTLFDALRMPDKGQEIGSEVPNLGEEPFFVLLQDDDTIANVSVTTDRLLNFPAEHQYMSDYAVLVINVKLHPIGRSGWSHVFD